MKPFFLQYKSITISWFMAFAIVLVAISSFIVKALAKEYGEDKEQIDDMLFTLLISGFVGSRIFYALTNFNLYRENIFLVFKISHYNLSLIGGVITGVLTLTILAKKNKREFQKLLKLFVIPFYFSMAIGVWVVIFDKFLLPLNISNNSIKVLYMSGTFLVGMILEIGLSNKIKNKYATPIILMSVILFYRLIILI